MHTQSCSLEYTLFNMCAQIPICCILWKVIFFFLSLQWFRCLKWLPTQKLLLLWNNLVTLFGATYAWKYCNSASCSDLRGVVTSQTYTMNYPACPSLSSSSFTSCCIFVLCAKDTEGELHQSHRHRPGLQPAEDRVSSAAWTTNPRPGTAADQDASWWGRRRELDIWSESAFK